MPTKVEISPKTILLTTLLAFSIWFVFQIWDILLMVFVSIILMSALNPIVTQLQRFHLPRWLAITVIYIALWGTLGTLIASIVPALIDQTSRLIRLLPAAANRFEFFNSHQQEISQQLLARVGALPSDLLRFTVSLFSNLLGVFTTIVISFYLLLEHHLLDRYLRAVTSEQNHDKSLKAVREIEHRLGAWVRGELILMLAVGCLTYLGLLALGIDSALPLAILAGFLEIVPNIGPTISAIPAVLVALSTHPVVALATAALYFLVQFAENHFLVPKVMQKTVGVNPLVSILALMIGFRLAGPAGAVLAIPAILVIQTIGLHFFSLKQWLPGGE